MKIIIIGSGNVATVLGRAARLAGHPIAQVVSRNHVHAAELARDLDCEASDLSSIRAGADLYILAIADQALPEVSARIALGRQLVAHTAGSVPKEVLSTVSSRYGVLYPLQSLRKEQSAIPIMPMLVDASDGHSLSEIEAFAKTISTHVKQAGDQERSRLHVAAVITNNFSNHLYRLTEEFCNREQVDFNLLLPLINETVARLGFSEAGRRQTGPAIRNDFSTMERHLELLADYPPLHKLYELFSQSIRQFHDPNI